MNKVLPTVLGMAAAVGGAIGRLIPRGHNERHGKAGLRERIQNAKTAQEIDALLAEGETYQRVSAKVRRSWMKSAVCARKRFA